MIRTEITIETERVVLVRRDGRCHFCAFCEATTGMLTVEEAARFLDVSAEIVARWLAAGIFHHTAAPDGSPLICFESLAQ